MKQRLTEAERRCVKEMVREYLIDMNTARLQRHKCASALASPVFARAVRLALARRTARVRLNSDYVLGLLGNLCGLAG